MLKKSITSCITTFVFPPSLQNVLCVWGFVNCGDNWTQIFFHFPCITQMYIQQHTLGVNLFSLLLCVFSYILGSSELPWWRTTYKKKHAWKHSCVFLLECVTTHIRLQQVLLLKTWWIQVLTGVCSVITIHVTIQIVVWYLYVHMYKYFGYVPYVHTQLAVSYTCILYAHLCFAYVFSLVFGSTRWWLRWAEWIVENNLY